MKITLVIAAIILTGCTQSSPPNQPETESRAKETSVMKLASSAFEHNQSIPPRYTCDADDVSPPLAIADVPQDAQSLALIVDDPDAPGGDWVHWIVWNIDPSISEITENSVPAGSIEGTTDFGRTSWGGPCPPSGEHRYQFKLYALDTELNLAPSAKKANLEQAMQNHTLDQTQLVGLYKRQ